MPVAKIQETLEAFEALLEEKGELCEGQPTLTVSSSLATTLERHVSVGKETVAEHLKILLSLKVLAKSHPFVRRSDKGLSDQLRPAKYQTWTLLIPGARIERVNGYYRIVGL